MGNQNGLPCVTLRFADSTSQRDLSVIYCFKSILNGSSGKISMQTSVILDLKCVLV